MAAGHEQAGNGREIVQKAAQKKYETRHKKRLLPGGNFAEHIKKAAKAGNNAKSRTKKKCCFPKKEPVKTCYFRDIAESFSVFF